MKKILIGLLLLVAVFLIGSGIVWANLQGPVDPNNKEDVVVEIKSGTSSTAIGNILKEKDLIKSVFVYRVYLKTNHINDLKASK